jgi:hypothetical protein
MPSIAQFCPSLHIREHFRELLESRAPVWQFAIGGCGNRRRPGQKVPMRRVLKQLRSVDTPDGTVVLDVETGKMFRLNPIGAQILCLLKQSAPIGQVEEVISREYHVEIETAREDVRHFLTALADCGLVDRNAADSGL